MKRLVCLVKIAVYFEWGEVTSQRLKTRTMSGKIKLLSLRHWHDTGLLTHIKLSSGSC